MPFRNPAAPSFCAPAIGRLTMPRTRHDTKERRTIGRRQGKVDGRAPSTLRAQPPLAVQVQVSRYWREQDGPGHTREAVDKAPQDAGAAVVEKVEVGALGRLGAFTLAVALVLGVHGQEREAVPEAGEGRDVRHTETQRCT